MRTRDLAQRPRGAARLHADRLRRHRLPDPAGWVATAFKSPTRRSRHRRRRVPGSPTTDAFGAVGDVIDILAGSRSELGADRRPMTSGILLTSLRPAASYREVPLPAARTRALRGPDRDDVPAADRDADPRLFRIAQLSICRLVGVNAPLESSPTPSASSRCASSSRVLDELIEAAAGRRLSCIAFDRRAERPARVVVVLAMRSPLAPPTGTATCVVDGVAGQRAGVADRICPRPP